MANDTTATDLSARAAAVLHLREDRGDLLVLGVPGTEYELHLGRSGELNAVPGKRVRGEIHAQALRMHRADVGGQFIEPVYGMPRIVQGLVAHIDHDHNRVLMEMPVPVWVTLHEGNRIDEFTPGSMWNCYLESGTRFVIHD